MTQSNFKINKSVADTMLIRSTSVENDSRDDIVTSVHMPNTFYTWFMQIQEILK